MKIVAKTLNGKQLPVDIELTWTVRQIKEELEKVHQLAADSLKLIAYGKVLDKDDSTAADYSIKENDFIVAMVQKKKPAAKPKPDEKMEEVKKEEVPPVTATNPTDSTQPPATVPTESAQTQPAAQEQTLPPEVEAAVNELMSISGKPRELCLQALAAAQNIPDVAFEFLMSGHIPQVPLGGGAQGQEPDYGDEGDEGGEGGMGGLGQYNLDPATLQAIQALVSNPSFPMIRQRMIQDPNFSTQFMQQLQQTQPQIFNAIQQNPGILMSLILGHDPMAGMGGGQPGGGMGGGPGGPPPGSIQVSPEEMASIQNLQQLGFTKERAAEAYFACDKNEEMAANFLFEAGAMDEDTATANAIAASQAEIANPGGANPQPEGESVAVPQVPAEESQAEGGQSQENPDQPKPDNSNNDDKKDEAGDGGDAAMGGEGGGEGSSLV